MIRILRQTWAGCGDLPHVGPHPGNMILLMMLIIGTTMGGDSLVEAAQGLLFMGAFAGPIYLLGAYERAQFSSHLTATQEELRKAREGAGQALESLGERNA